MDRKVPRTVQDEELLVPKWLFLLLPTARKQVCNIEPSRKSDSSGNECTFSTRSQELEAAAEGVEDDDNAPSVAPMRHESAASSVSCAASKPADSLLSSWCHVNNDEDGEDEEPLAIKCSGAVHEKTKSGRPANRAISLSSAR